jgi:hypothetical protein
VKEMQRAKDIIVEIEEELNGEIYSQVILENREEFMKAYFES